MKHFSFFFTVALVFILAGCQNQETTPVSPEDFATLSKVPVPIKLIVDGTTSVDPATMLVTFNATGIGSHFGNCTATGYTTLQFTGPNYGNLINGSFLIVVANGDELYLEGTGTFVINGLTTEYVLNYVFTGGTGRFADATGNIDGTGIGEQIDPGNPLVKSVHLEGSGSILY